MNTDDIVNGWEDRGIFEGGHSLGDEQVGPDVSHRYVKKCPDGTWLVADVIYAAMGRNLDSDDFDLPPEYWIDELTIFTQCTDPDDPGGTEIDSEFEYGQGSHVFYATQRGAEESALRMAENDLRPYLANLAD